MSKAKADPQQAKLDIVFQDSQIVILDKPPGIHSSQLPKSPAGEVSVASLLKDNFPGIEKCSPKPEDGGLIHRLDFETSGLLIAARSRASWEALQLSQKNGEIRKSYLALVEGHLPEELEVRVYLGAKGRSAKKMRAYLHEPRGAVRAQLSESKIAPVLFLSELNLTLVRVEIGQGKRHQIRAHSAFMGHPLVGDTLYGSNLRLPFASEAQLDFILHAYEIELPHPGTGERHQFRAALPYETPDNKKGPISALFSKISELTQ